MELRGRYGDLLGRGEQDVADRVEQSLAIAEPRRENPDVDPAEVRFGTPVSERHD